MTFVIYNIYVSVDSASAITASPTESGSSVAVLLGASSYKVFNDKARTSVPHNMDRGKRSIRLLFLYSLHLSVTIGGQEVVRIFIYGHPFLSIFKKNI